MRNVEDSFKNKIETKESVKIVLTDKNQGIIDISQNSFDSEPKLEYIDYDNIDSDNDSNDDIDDKIMLTKSIDYSCEKCDFKARNSHTLKLHVKSLHKDSVKGNVKLKVNKRKRKTGNFSCDVCDVICDNKSSLKIHIKNSHDSKK